MKAPTLPSITVFLQLSCHRHGAYRSAFQRGLDSIQFPEPHPSSFRSSFYLVSVTFFPENNFESLIHSKLFFAILSRLGQKKSHKNVILSSLGQKKTDPMQIPCISEISIKLTHKHRDRRMRPHRVAADLVRVPVKHEAPPTKRVNDVKRRNRCALARCISRCRAQHPRRKTNQSVS